MYCKNCGNQLVEGAAFCPNCGCAAEKTQSGAGQRNVAKGVLLILAGVAVIVITILWAIAQYNAY